MCRVHFQRTEGPEKAGKLCVETRTASIQQDEVTGVIAALVSVVKQCRDQQVIGMVSIYDLSQLPSMAVVPLMMPAVKNFVKEWAPVMDGMVLSSAVVLKDSFWSTAARKVVNIILEISPPKCPFLLTHSRELAEEFVHTNFKEPISVPSIDAQEEPSLRLPSVDERDELAPATPMAGQASVSSLGRQPSTRCRAWSQRLATLRSSTSLFDGSPRQRLASERVRFQTLVDLEEDMTPGSVRGLARSFANNLHFAFDELVEDEGSPKKAGREQEVDFKTSGGAIAQLPDKKEATLAKVVEAPVARGMYDPRRRESPAEKILQEVERQSPAGKHTESCACVIQMDTPSCCKVS